MKYYDKKMEKLLLRKGFVKEIWDGRRKIFCKYLEDKSKMMIIPQGEPRKFYRVEIWPFDFPDSVSQKLFSIGYSFMEKAIDFLEEWKNKFIKIKLERRI